MDTKNFIAEKQKEEIGVAFNINVSEANKKYKVIIKGFAIPSVKKRIAETKEEILELFLERI